ncbi:DUF6266 family protein [Pedobacter sp. GR22-6]|uniref:DUF6266 family protein n=1 Tax=Pedobacter sp. GR22-6 TaxID=3127957 RepID=UPI00307F9465
MGILKNGAFGHLNGRVGNLVSYTSKGKNVTRTIGHSDKAPSPAKLANYQKMAVVNAFLKPVLPFINLGFFFAVQGTDRNQHNEAVSYNKKHAMQGSYPDIHMDYSKAMLSMGTLAPAIQPKVTKTEAGIRFNWDFDESTDWGTWQDRAMLLLYFTDEMEAKYVLSGARRREAQDFIALPSRDLQRPMQCYVAFVASDLKNVSDSVWAGGI